MLVKRLGGFSVRVGDDDLGEIFPKRFKNRTCLDIGTFIENLAEISEPVNAWHQHPEPLGLANLLADPS